MPACTRRPRLWCSPLVLVVLSLQSAAQSPGLAALTPLSQANQAFSAGKPVASVAMAGTVKWYAGKTEDSGPVKLTASVTGRNSAEFDLSNGTRIESQSAVSNDRTCTWSGKDGITHAVDQASCWTAVVWFLPHLAVQGSGQPSSLSMIYQGVDTGKAQGEIHVRHQLTISPGTTKPSVTALIQKLSATDLDLDPGTSLPVSLRYSIHPDRNANIDLKVEVRYSNYQNISGAELPMHIERYVNGTLQLSMDITSATIN